MPFSCQRDQLFISYSHADRPWVDRLQTMIRPLLCSEALLLVSAELLASEFVTNSELPALLEAAEHEGLRILWVCLSDCFYEETPISDYQAVLDPRQLLDEMGPVQQRGALKTIASAICDALWAEPEHPAPSPPDPPPAPAGPGPLAGPPALSVPLQRFPSTTCLLRRYGDRWPVERSPVTVEGYREELAEAVALGPFFLGQTPITQAQWRAVALWEQVERALPPDPSRFKGPNRPVERVSWHDAMEFCRRLSLHTGKRYGLPSEARWDYACRAGSTTPFHFGATLTPELANYDGTSAYGDGPRGTDRQQTTDVASFPANAWGLHDMHGNVWECCADHWHPSYASSSIGFRVCCLPRDQHLDP